jgi:hypothetical protein
MDSFKTQVLLHCYQATDEEYRIAADSLIRLCLWLGGELIFSFLEELPKESNALLESLTEPPSEGLQDTITNG